MEKKPNNNLIDLNLWEPPAALIPGVNDPSRVRVSILEAFDPLCSSHDGGDSNGNAGKLEYTGTSIV